MSTISAINTTPLDNDPDFDSFRESLDERLKTAAYGGKLFATDATGLYEAYLEAIPEDRRQHYRCNCCKRFIEQFGGLVVLDQKNHLKSVFWDNATSPMFAAMNKIVKRARIEGPFLTSSNKWGSAVTGDWTHLAAHPPERFLHKKAVLTAEQLMAEKKEDFKNVARALGEFDHDCLAAATKLLETEALYRSEKVAGPARWLQEKIGRASC